MNANMSLSEFLNTPTFQPGDVFLDNQNGWYFKILHISVSHKESEIRYDGIEYCTQRGRVYDDYYTASQLAKMNKLTPSEIAKLKAELL